MTKHVSMPALALCSAALALAGCATTPTLGGDPGLTVIGSQSLPAPSAADTTAPGRQYHVGPFDRLTVDVLGIEALTGREVQVDGDGNIALPMVGAVNVAGRTTSEVRALVTERLRAAYVRDPQVSVGLREAVSQVLTIGGQVARPGVYPVMGDMTLLRALAVAGDTREDADLQDVIVFRTVAGQRYAALYDVERIRHGAYPDPEIFANDLVMVGDDQSRRLFREVLSTFSLVSGPLVIMIDRIAN